MGASLHFPCEVSQNFPTAHSAEQGRKGMQAPVIGLQTSEPSGLHAGEQVFRSMQRKFDGSQSCAGPQAGAQVGIFLQLGTLLQAKKLMLAVVNTTDAK